MTVQVGDTVVWDWRVDISVRSYQVQLYITNQPSSNFTQILSTRIGKSRANATNYRYTFYSNRIYYYAVKISGYNSSYNSTELHRGVINVTSLQAHLPALKVCVGDTALGKYYCTKKSSSGFVEGYPSPGSCTAGNSCLGDLSGSSRVPTITYSPLSTPVVEYVDPQEGVVSETVFTIYGTGFSSDVRLNKVNFGPLPCELLSASNKILECKVSTTPSAPIAWKDYFLSLLVRENNTGYAFVQTPSKSKIRISPKIFTTSPLYGSVKGGTDIVISGSTFLFKRKFTVGVPCKILKLTPTEIICRTLEVESQHRQILTRNISLCLLPKYAPCTKNEGIYFTYSKDHTPNVTSLSLFYTVSSTSIILYFYGEKFSDMDQWNVIKVGDHSCNVTTFNQTFIICRLPALPASYYFLSFIVCNASSTLCLGYAEIPDHHKKIRIHGFVSNISPSSGSILGGTELTIEGSGFHKGIDPFALTVSIGNSACLVTSINFTRVKCVTEPHLTNIDQPQLVEVSVNSISFRNDYVTFTFSSAAVLNMTNIEPKRGQVGDLVNLTGTHLGAETFNADEVTVEIGESRCKVLAGISSYSSISCLLGINIVGNYSISVHVYSYGFGHLVNDVTFEYVLEVYNVSVTEGSFAGGNVITVHGAGFDPSDSRILICGRTCRHFWRLSTLAQMVCRVPRASQLLTNDQTCDVELQSKKRTALLVNGYKYSVALTPLVKSINRSRGGTAGGSVIQITGEGFTNSHVAGVTMARSVCDIKEQNSTSITCVTGASSRTVRREVLVFVSGKGYSWSYAFFWYVDLWSSEFTWKNHTLPSEGDLVVISRGQTLVLDIATPILSIVIIQGGELIFDEEAGDNQVSLHTQRLLIVSQGKLIIGTEKRPFLAQTEVVLYGHVLSTELPIYGTKNIALREGEISVHGQPINITWTKLIFTVLPGANTIYLRDWVSWKVGGRIAIASTSFSQRENEVRDIQSILPGLQGSILVLTEPLEFEHISVRQTIAGRLIDTSAEVGYLTRNVVFRGDTNEEWNEVVTGCDREFRPGPYQVQTCFRGRFGDETRGDLFGGHIFVQAATPNTNQVSLKLSFVEITSFGQAYRLGRYPINFHVNGNMMGSYVKGCSIHHTFNRAVSILNTNHLLLEKNVVYDTLGHGFSLDDGTEQYNIIQDNLGIFIKPSTTSLNVDMSPSVFWVVNANNIVRRNAAAGSSHYGFWYSGSRYGTASSSQCLQKWPVLEFEDNSAHSLGLHGLWILRYFPSFSGSCADNRHAPSQFNRLLSWRNKKGVSSIYCGSIQVRDSVILDSVTDGIEFTELLSVWGENGAMVSNSLIAGHSIISEAGFCTPYGLTVPSSYYLTVTNVTFAGFNTGTCFPIHSCATPCLLHQGGFETRYEMITLLNVSQITKWNWEHEHVHYDTDGTLTGIGRPSILLPHNQLLDPSECKVHSMSSSGSVKGSICNGTIKFGRLVISNPRPRSLRFTYLNVSNDFGAITLPYVLERNARYGFFRYMAVLQLNATSYYGYWLTWLEGEMFANVSYRIQTSGTAQSDYFLLSQQFPQPLDQVTIRGTESGLNEFLLEDLATGSHGDYTLSNNGTLLSYLLRGNHSTSIRARKCFHEGCIIPQPSTASPPIPPQRSNDSLLWSSNSSWVGNEVPKDGQDCIVSNVYLLLDVAHVRCEKLELIGSTLEVLDGEDRIIESIYIIVHGGAKLVAGYPDMPFFAKLRFVLHGDSTSPELRVGSSPPISSRTIAVFGELILTAPPIANETWTTLSAIGEKGTSSLSLSQRVNWLAGDIIVITSSSYDPYQSEVLTIKSVSSDGLTLELNGTLSHSHEGRNDTLKYFGAEVGYLSRTITIENYNSQIAKQQSFGCRLLVSQSFPHQGVVSLSGVGFKACGQLGYRDDYDSRFALVFLNLMGIGVRSNVTQCSFVDGYSPAIGVLNSNGISVEDNVIHGTVGASMILRGTGLRVTHNLASLAQCVGLYQNVIQRHNRDWTANYRIEPSSTNLIFEYNCAAGGAMACFHINGENQEEEGSVLLMRNNIGHSCLHGVHLGYTDGHVTGSKFENFTLSHCYFFGFFSYSPASIFISNSVFVNNLAAIFASVIGPPSVGHTVGEKSVVITNTVIISRLNSTSCSARKPPIVEHQNSDGIQSPTGGHVGVIIPSFLSGRGPFPFGSWHSVTSYPAINGSTSITNVTFMNFDAHCDNGEKDVLLMTNPSSEDANHPVYLSGITDFACPNESKVYLHPPNIGLVNPSDCVDMYCDGKKNVLINDKDGSFTGVGYPRSIIPLAELDWDGTDRRAGIGDFRLPNKMLTNPDGSRINKNDIYPLKGIVRGETFGRDDDCSFMSEWNAYLCQNLKYLMMVLESLDADTEVRRLSPVAYGANGFVNLVNGPMDHGFCGGYSCQERISSFFFLMAVGFSYIVSLTSNNPQNMALHLLQADTEQAVSVAIIYNSPQRLDVSVDTNGVDTYIVPNNAFLDNGNLNYRQGDAAGFIPSLSDSHGSNFYDRSSKKLFITLRGKRPVKIITSSVVMVSLSLSVSANEFFDETELIRNIAFLLEIPNDKIRIVSVTRETTRRRKRQAANSQTLLITFEIGDSPFSLYDISNSISITCSTPSPSNSSGSVVGSNACSANSSISTSSQSGIGSSLCSNSSYNSSSSSNFTYYSSVTNNLVDLLQAGMLNYSLGSFSLLAPVAPAVDPTGGIRATVETGGPQPGNASNNTLTFSELQQLLQSLSSNSSTGMVMFTIPCYLVVKQLASSNVVEGVPITSGNTIRLALLTCDLSLCTRLGLDETWVATVSAQTKPDGAFLTGTVKNFTSGISSFDDLVFSHPGSYLLAFAVSYPAIANFIVVAPRPVEVLERQLAIAIVQQPQQGNDTFPLYPYPVIQLVDPSNGNALVSEHTWRNTIWYAEAAIIGSGRILVRVPVVSGVRVPVVSGVATFDNLRVSSDGDYQLEFSAYQLAQGSGTKLGLIASTSSRFQVLALSALRVTYTYNINFSTVAGSQNEFLGLFRTGFQQFYNYVEVINTTLSNDGGRIVVVVYVTASSSTLLDRIGIDITVHKVHFTFVYNGINYTPFSTAIDWRRSPSNNKNNNFKISIYLVIFILSIPYCCIIGVGLFCLGWRQKIKKRSKVSVTRVSFLLSRKENCTLNSCYKIIFI